VGARPFLPRNFRSASARGDRARRRTRMGLRAHPFRRLPRMRRKGEAQRSSLQTLRRNPRRRKSRQTRPWHKQQQRREPCHTSAAPTNATVGARHAVPGKRTWHERAIHAGFSGTGNPACATKRYIREVAKARIPRRRCFKLGVLQIKNAIVHPPSTHDPAVFLRWRRLKPTLLKGAAARFRIQRPGILKWRFTTREKPSRQACASLLAFHPHRWQA
jgi:hypothetical protein